jgi:hypothetical protein
MIMQPNIKIDMKPITERPIDVVMFGKSCPRRELIKSRILEQHPDWKVEIKVLTDIINLTEAYSNAKICLTVHATPGPCGGEYHRLSETAPFGCVSVLENVTDACWLNPYMECAGVHFATFDTIISKLAEVMDGIRTQPDHWLLKQSSMVEWWRKSNSWQDQLLKLA